MPKKDMLTKIITFTGVNLTWLPLLAPLIFAIVHVSRGGQFFFDFLAPAELFPLILVGAGLLFWAAWRARTYRRWIAWSLGLAVFFLFGSQAIAEWTGLADGTTPPDGWEWVLVLIIYGAFCAAALSLAIAGVALLRSVMRKEPVEKVEKTE